MNWRNCSLRHRIFSLLSPTCHRILPYFVVACFFESFVLLCSILFPYSWGTSALFPKHFWPLSWTFSTPLEEFRFLLELNRFVDFCFFKLSLTDVILNHWWLFWRVRKHESSSLPGECIFWEGRKISSSLFSLSPFGSVQLSLLTPFILLLSRISSYQNNHFQLKFEGSYLW